MKTVKLILSYLLRSFTTEEGGASARKLTAWACVSTAIYLSYKHSDASNVLDLVLTWLCCACLCLGLVTVAQLIQFKNGKDGNNNGESPKV